MLPAPDGHVEVICYFNKFKENDQAISEAQWIALIHPFLDEENPDVAACHN